MNPATTQFIKKAFRKFDLVVARTASFEENVRNARATDDLDLLSHLPGEHTFSLLQQLPKSRAQYRQDLFVLSQTGCKRSGFFVEFGATNGVDISNTHLLEKEFGWSGIVAEPARCWHEALKRNRSCAVVTDCVWRQSGEVLQFNEVSHADYSTLVSFNDTDRWSRARRNGTTYPVQTISLNDLLTKFQAPSHVDYLSIDTEGSEFDILSALDFDRWSFGVITCEHNYTHNRERIFDLLRAKGYRRVFEQFSKFDDWYVKE
jgi:FkbM family methyltransferase